MVNLQEVTRMSKVFVSENSTSILTTLGAVGVVSTAVLAVRATPKALRIIEAERFNQLENNDDPEYVFRKREVVKLTWKLYIPAFAVGAVSIGCIVGANHIGLKRNAALAGAYAIVDRAFTEYQDKVVEILGADKDEEIRGEIYEERLRTNPVSQNDVFSTGRGNELCYDLLTGRYFTSDMNSIEHAENELNRQLMQHSYASLSDFYGYLGLPGTKLGDLLGWTSDDLVTLTYSAKIADDGRPCIVIDYPVEPKTKFDLFN